MKPEPLKGKGIDISNFGMHLDVDIKSAVEWLKGMVDITFGEAMIECSNKVNRDKMSAIIDRAFEDVFKPTNTKK